MITLLDNYGKSLDTLKRRLPSYIAMLREIPYKSLPEAFIEAQKESPEFMPGPQLIISHWKYLQNKNVENKNSTAWKKLLPTATPISRDEIKEVLQDLAKKGNPFAKRYLREEYT